MTNGIRATASTGDNDEAVVRGLAGTARTITSAALAGPDVKDPLAVVVITTFDLDEYVHGALRAGATGFLLAEERGAASLTP